MNDKEYLLAQTKRSYTEAARRLGEYSKISTDLLADGYCAACDLKDSMKQDSYIAALILRFWNKINNLYASNSSLELQHDDYLSWIQMSIIMACAPDARTWQTNPKMNAEQAIMQTLNTRFKAQAYYEANLDIHKANYNSASLEDKYGDDDSDTCLMDVLPDTASEDFKADLDVRSLIQTYINDNKVVEAIILDSIAYNDVEKLTKDTIKTVAADGTKHKYAQYNREFWSYKLVQILSKLPDNYASYFSKKYVIGEGKLAAAVNSVRTSTNTKLYKSINNTIKTLKNAMQI